MKVSVNWLRQFTDIKLDVDQLVEKIGAQLGAVEEVIDIGKKYQGIVAAKVISCEKHPNADKLSICKIDDGGVAKKVKRDRDGYVQVVCGASNVRKSLAVAWLPPGATVPNSFDKEPFVLDARDIRGELSNGMLASAHELGFSDDHNGILELDIDAKPGSDFADLYELNDYVIDIENKMFTHRPDLFGILGIAREVAGIQNIQFKSPEWYLKALDRIKPGTTKLPLVVRNEIPDLVPRFMMVAMANVKIGPSPIIIQSYLSRVGIRPINNIVDVTNYLMVLTGQPLHAFDYDKIAANSEQGNASIVVRKPKEGEKLKLLGGKEIMPREGAIVIATDKMAVGLGGVMGGADTEVDENTKNIIIECANFDMYSIRRSAMAHGLFTDAVTRFTKGQSALQNDRILEEAVATIEYVSGAHVASDVFDLQGDIKELPQVHVGSDFINARLGLNIKAKEMATRLQNVEFGLHVTGETLTIKPPFWRTDIHIPEDIVEEVGRLIGYDQLPLQLPKRTIRPAKHDEVLGLKAKLRNALVKAGANEVLTYSFVHGNLLEKVGQNRGNAFQLANALSPDLQYYRLSLLPSLLDKVYGEIKAGLNQFAIFEINQTHTKDLIDKDKLPIEQHRLAFAFAANDKTAQANYAGAPYYQAQRYLLELFKSLGIEVVFEPLAGQSLKSQSHKDRVAPFELSRAAFVMTKDGKLLGEVGEIKASVRENLKLSDFVAGFELDVLSLLENKTVHSPYTPLSRFPSVEQDISLKVPDNLAYGELRDFILKKLEAAKETHGYESSLSPLDIYQSKQKSQKHMAFRVKLSHYDKTLTAQEVNKLLDDIAADAKKKFGAERI